MNYLHSDKIKVLENKSNEIRKLMTSSFFDLERKRPVSSLEAINIFTLLYFHVLKHNPKDPEWEERDRLILSNRHIYPALYATMAHAGYFSVEELNTLHKSELFSQGYPTRAFLPGVDTNFGMRGSLSQAVGMTLADKIDSGRSSDKFFYCFLDSKELQEGQNWEAIKMAGKQNLHNLITILNKNNFEEDSFIEDTMLLKASVSRLETLNWHVLNANSNDFDDMDDVIWQAQAVFAKPTIIVMHNGG